MRSKQLHTVYSCLQADRPMRRHTHACCCRCAGLPPAGRRPTIGAHATQSLADQSFLFRTTNSALQGPPTSTSSKYLHLTQHIMEPVAVVGAGGRTGAECVKALSQAGRTVRAVVREPAKYASSLGGQGVEVVQGDVGNVQSLRQALSGCGGVIFAASGTGYWSAKEVDYQGVANVAEVCKEQGGGKHVVLVSSALVSPHNRFNPIRIMLNNFRWSLMDYKYKGEELLRKSGLPYTVVRPGGLTSDPPGQAKLVAGQGDTMSGRVSRADVAAVCVAALTDPAARNVTLELVGKPAVGAEGAAPAPLAQQLKELFSGLKADSPPA